MNHINDGVYNVLWDGIDSEQHFKYGKDELFEIVGLDWAQDISPSMPGEADASVSGTEISTTVTIAELHDLAAMSDN